jgi:hypothetical protein
MINVNDLHREQENRNSLKKKTYEKIIEDLGRVIRNRSRLGQKECFLSVPAFVIGKPLYNIRQATKYVIYKMRKNGFEVYDGGSNEIYVSWRLPAERKADEKPRHEPDDDDFMLPSFANLKKSANHVRSLSKTKRL